MKSLPAVKNISCCNIVLGILIFALATTSNAESGQQSITLDVKKNDNWPVEHCFSMAAGQSVSYQFDGPYKTKFGAHNHVKKDGKHISENIIEGLDVAEYSGNITAETAGPCCFTWEQNKVNPYPGDWQLNLKYQFDKKNLPQKNK